MKWKQITLALSAAVLLVGSATKAQDKPQAATALPRATSPGTQQSAGTQPPAAAPRPAHRSADTPSSPFAPGPIPARTQYTSPPTPTPVAVPKAVTGYPDPYRPVTTRSPVLQQVVIQLLIADVDRKQFAAILADELDDELTDQVGRQFFSRIVNETTRDAIFHKLREKKNTLKVIARPQIRMLNGTTGRLQIAGKPIRNGGIEGLFDLKTTPTIVDDKKLKLNIQFARLPGPAGQHQKGADPEPIEETNVEAVTKDRDCLIAAVPQKVFTHPGAEPDPRIRIVVAEPHRVKAIPSTRYTQTSPRPSYKPAESPAYVPYRIPEPVAHIEYPIHAGTQQPPAHVIQALKADAAHRVVTIAAHGAQLANVNDRVDVLLITPPPKDKDIGQVQVICENVLVCSSRTQSKTDVHGGHWVSLLVRKDKVENLLISEQLGQLRLTLHRSARPQPPVATPVQPTGTWQAAPPVAIEVPLGALPKYKESKPSLSRQPQQAPAGPRSEIKQLLQEIRLLREVIQGVRDDVGQLKQSVRSEPKLSPEQLKSSKMLSLKEGMSIHIQTGKPLTRIAIADPKIIDTVQYGPDEIGIVGMNAGETNFTLWKDGTREPQVVRVKVAPARFPVTGIRTDVGARVAATHREIRESLSKQVELHVEKKPLSETLKSVAETTGVNIVIDKRGIEEEGLSIDQPVSIDVEGIRLSSLLRLMLEPLNLDHVVEHEVLKITSRSRANGRQIAKAYNVSSLLSRAGDDDGAHDLKILTELIVGVVDPDSWDEVGGPGTIRPNVGTKSLIVRQSEQAHDQIAHLLTALRAQKESQSIKPSAGNDSAWERVPTAEETQATSSTRR